MPGLVVGEINIAGLAEDRLRPLPFKLQCFRRETARIMAARDKLGRPLLDGVNVTKSSSSFRLVSSDNSDSEK
jgi:hypothetical protein